MHPWRAPGSLDPFGIDALRLRVEGQGVSARRTAGRARGVARQSPDDAAGAGTAIAAAGTARGGDCGEYAAWRCEEGVSGCGGPFELQLGSLLVHCSISKANSESPRPVGSISVSEANKLEEGQLRPRRVAPETCRVDGIVGCMLSRGSGGKYGNRDMQLRTYLVFRSSRVLSSGHRARVCPIATQNLCFGKKKSKGHEV